MSDEDTLEERRESIRGRGRERLRGPADGRLMRVTEELDEPSVRRRRRCRQRQSYMVRVTRSMSTNRASEIWINAASSVTGAP